MPCGPAVSSKQRYSEVLASQSAIVFWVFCLFFAYVMLPVPSVTIRKVGGDASGKSSSQKPEGSDVGYKGRFDYLSQNLKRSTLWLGYTSGGRTAGARK